MVYWILGIVGLCFGSFINAFVWRIHEQAKSKTKRADPKLSIVTGRSMCTHCGHTLAPKDLVPLLSWLSLGGKCRYCHKPIGWQYPLVELLTAALFVFSYVHWPTAFQQHIAVFLPFWLVFVAGFIALAVYDLRWMLLPDRIVLPLQALAGVYLLVELLVQPSKLHMFIGIVLGLLCSAGLFYALFQVSKGKWIGGGDVKLAVVLGTLLGSAQNALLMLFIASVMGSLVGIPLILGKKTGLSSKIPFGPFLIVATIFIYLFGASVITWYKRQLLFA